MSIRKEPLHANGWLKTQAMRYWALKHVSDVTDIHIKGDGFITFFWDDGEEDGKYHVRIDFMLRDLQELGDS